MAKGGPRLGAGRPAHRLKAENAITLNVTYLARHGHLDAGNWKRLYWQQFGEVRLEGLVRAFEGHITVGIGNTSHWVGLTQTACHLGGFRRWFICPQCNKRMGVLYMRHGHFACRHCQQISYQSQSGDAEDRLIWKYHSLQHTMNNLKLKSPRSRARIFNNFLKVAWQYDALLDEAVSRIEMADATR
jgi:hypothetical protein